MTEGETAESLREFLSTALAHRHPAAARVPHHQHRRPPRPRPRRARAPTATRWSRAPSRASSARSPSTRRCVRWVSSATGTRSSPERRATSSTGRSPMRATRSSPSTKQGEAAPAVRRRRRTIGPDARGSTLLRAAHRPAPRDACDGFGCRMARSRARAGCALPVGHRRDGAAAGRHQSARSPSRRRASAAAACAGATAPPTSSAPCRCRASSASVRPERPVTEASDPARAPVDSIPMADGPLIVQSDRTVLLEVAHPDAESARHELAIFAELERAPEHIHTYRITRLGLWNARAAGHDADDMLATLDRWTRFPVPPIGLDRHPRDRRPLRPPRHRARRRTVVSSFDRRMPRCWPRSRRTSASSRSSSAAPPPTRSRSTPGRAGTSSRSCSRSAGRPRISPATRRGRRIRSTSLKRTGQLRPYQREAVDKFTDGGSGVVVLPCGAGKTLVGAAAMADTKTTTLILVTNTVSARQWRDELLKRTSLTAGGDRRVLGSGQRGQARHDRDLPDPHREAEGRVRPSRAARRPRLGPHRLRRGAPAARARLQAHRRSAGAPPPRTHRDPRPRGRPRGRRLQPHRPQAVRRAVEGDRGPGLHLTRGLLRGARRPARRRPSRVRRGRRRGSLPPRGDGVREDPGRARPRRAARGRAHPRHRPVPRPDRCARRSARRTEDHRLDARRRARGALPGVPRRRDRGARRVEGRELLDRPARGIRRHPGVGILRLSAGGGPAPRTPAAAQAVRPTRRASTRSSPATPSTRTSRRTASASSPSRATATRSWTRSRSRPDRPPDRRQWLFGAPATHPGAISRTTSIPSP